MSLERRRLPFSLISYLFLILFKDAASVSVIGISKTSIGDSVGVEIFVSGTFVNTGDTPVISFRDDTYGIYYATASFVNTTHLRFASVPLYVEQKEKKRRKKRKINNQSVPATPLL